VNDELALDHNNNNTDGTPMPHDSNNTIAMNILVQSNSLPIFTAVVDILVAHLCAFSLNPHPLAKLAATVILLQPLD
jgi:hypothetical protein